MTKHQISRLSEKLHRLAYELEHDAARLGRDNPSYAAAVKKLSSDMGDIARYMHRSEQQ